MNEKSGKTPSDQEIAALADGSLSAERRREIENQVAGSDQIRESIAGQRAAVGLVGEIDAVAPDALKARVSEMVAEKAPARRRRFAIGGVAAAAAAVLVALVLVLGGGSSGPDVDQVVASAGDGPSMPAPAADPTRPGKLALGVGGVQFPTWEEADWEVTGARSDAVDGRPVNTVFYTNRSGGSVKYSIVSGAPIDSLASADDYEITGSGDTRRIVWRNGGHTCIIVAKGVPSGQLEHMIY